MILGFYFEGNTFCTNLNIFECSEVTDQVYNGFRTYSKNKPAGLDTNCNSNRNKQGGEAAPPSGSAKSHAGKCKKISFLIF